MTPEEVGFWAARTDCPYLYAAYQSYRAGNDWDVALLDAAMKLSASLKESQKTLLELMKVETFGFYSC